MADRVLVTGASGFIGSALTPFLASAGYDVYALERYVSNRYNVPSNAKIKTVFADLTDHLAIDSLIRQIRPEIMIHLAALSAVASSYNRWQEFLEVNFNGTVNLAESVLRHDSNLKQFVYAGSSECYGNQKKFPIKETAKYKPNSPYSVSKAASIRYLEYMWNCYSFPITILLPFNTYGRQSCQHFVTERIIWQMLNDQTVYLGDPEPTRDLLYIDDHVAAYLSTLNVPQALGERFNFCTGRGVSIKELTEKIRKLTNFKGNVVWNTITKRPLDITKLVGDNSKAKSILNWEPMVDLDSGLEKTVKILKGNMA